MTVNGFEWVEDISVFDERFIKSYNEEIDKGFFLEVDVKNPEKLNNLHNDLPFLLEKMKIKKVQKLVAIFSDKIEYDIHIRNLKQAFNHGLVLERYIE